MAGGKLISTGVEFPDATTQTTSALPLTGGTMTGTIAGFTSTGIDDNATSTAITIDANENVGIGTTSPDCKLDVRKSGTTAAQGDTDLFIGDSGAASSTAQVQILGGASGFSNLYFSDTGSYNVGGFIYNHTDNYLATNVNGAERMRIDSSGNVTVETGNLVIGTSGKGIDFSAATPDGTGSTGSEVLDDYEEGAWTATITTNGTDFSTSSRGTNAFYRKIGSQVTVWFGPSITSPTSGTGSLIVTGLPFTANHSAGMSITSGDIHFGRVDLIGTEGYFMQIAHNTSNIAFYYRIDNSNPGTMTADELNGNTTPYISGTLTYTAT